MIEGTLQWELSFTWMAAWDPAHGPQAQGEKLSAWFRGGTNRRLNARLCLKVAIDGYFDRDISEGD